ncbi:MAG: T9SS type A sorting domain-containing protein [Calditrichaeota bacterium]|nr:T9SS type A sorting domain-containing protein [Calditrichota bacterium]MBT7788397.1 T9SS type A sorting domain-containing protein [Calditrichota bacterium]
MYGKQREFLLIVLVLFFAASSLYSQEEYRQWTPPDGVTMRQGSHIEWYRGGESRDEGELAGEVAVVWSDTRHGDRGVFTQVLGADGEWKFDQSGLQVADSTGRQEDPGMWPDPTDGGWFVAWEDFDLWTVDGDVFGDTLGDIYCTKIDAQGNRIWGDSERGVPVSVFDSVQEDVRIVQDGEGGCIIAWRDQRGGDAGDIYAQHILANGTPDPRWPLNGKVVVAAPGSQINHTADSDGAGGMIIGWKDDRIGGDFNIWAQRIRSDGTMEWGDGEGILVCSHPAAQETPKLCPDGQGGAFFCWVDNRNANDSNQDIYGQRVDARGNLMWGAVDEGEAICTAEEEQIGNRIVISEPGTAIVCWEDKRSDGSDIDVYAMRIAGDNAIQRTWQNEQGEAVIIMQSNQSGPRLYPDGEGGAFFVWEDERFGGFPEIDIWIQRLNVEGQRMWADEGVPVVGATGEGVDGLYTQSGPLIRRTADGGCVVIWQDQRSGSIHLYSQRFNANGEAVWEDNGVALAEGYSQNALYPKVYGNIDNDGKFAVVWLDGRFSAQGTFPFIQYGIANGETVNTVLPVGGKPVISTDIVGGGIDIDATKTEDGGMILVWEDHRRNQPYAIYGQKVDGEGNLLWGDEGLRIAEFLWDQKLPLVCSDGRGGAIATWRAPTNDSLYNVFCQRINSDGERLWGNEGINITNNSVDETVEAIVPDKRGGAVIVWRASEDVFDTDDDLWIQRIDKDGEPVWDEGGKPLCNTWNKQRHAELVRHPEGFVVVWTDGRDDELGTPQDDIYGQFILPDGTFLWGDSLGYMICGEEDHQQYPDVDITTRGEIWIAWEDGRWGEPRQRDVYVQKINRWNPGENGRPGEAFPEDGSAICAANADQVLPKIHRDGMDGLWVTWEDYRGGVWSDIYATHLRPDSRPYGGWLPTGNLVCGATHKQNIPKLDILSYRNHKGAIMVWEDKRATGKEELSNTFVQFLNDNTVGAPIQDRSAHPNGYSLESVYPNPFNSQTLVTFVAPRDGTVNLKVYDVSGRFVTDIGTGYWSAGRHSVVFSASDLATGSYIVQLKVDGVQLQRQLQLIK